MRSIAWGKRLAVTGAAAIAALAIAVPASAGTTPPDCSTSPGCMISMTVTVPESLSLTGITNVAFPTTPGGQTATVTNAQTYVASTNNPTGYTLQLSADGGSLGQCNGGSGQPCFIAHNPGSGPNFNIPDQNNLVVTETGTHSGEQITQWNCQTGCGVPNENTINTTTAPTTGSGDTYTENYALSIPSSSAPGAYQGDAFYLLTANP